MHEFKNNLVKFAADSAGNNCAKIVNKVTRLGNDFVDPLNALIIILFAFMAGLTCNNALAATYLFAGPTTPYTWVDISSTSATPGINVTQAVSSAANPAVAAALTDDSYSPAIPIGFTFNYAGTNYTQLVVGSNGWLFFGTPSTVYVNTPVASVPVSNVLMPYWDDLDNGGLTGRIQYLTIGTAPNRQFVVSFIGVPTYGSAGSNNTFQVILYENGRFQFNYQATQLQGSSATIGYQVSAADFVQYATNTANSTPNLRTLTWYISPSLTNLKTVSTLSDPVNNTSQPKNIPGAVVQYKIDVSNTSVGIVDANTTIISDPIPANTELFTGGLSASAPFSFTDGAPTSGLTCAFISLASTTDCIEFSNNAGATWTYTPSAATDYDAAVTNIRFKPIGTLNGDTAPAAAPYPNFNLTFKVRIK
jgi:uncharacterized repeat protein (TIGR01451 family)